MILHGGSSKQVGANDGPTATGTSSTIQFPNPRRLAKVEKGFWTVPSSFRAGRQQSCEASQHSPLLHWQRGRRHIDFHKYHRRQAQSLPDSTWQIWLLLRGVSKCNLQMRKIQLTESARKWDCWTITISTSGRNWDAALSQQLQLDAELILEKAKKRIRQKEAVGEQQKELKASAEGMTRLEELCFRKKPKKGQHPHTVRKLSPELSKGLQGLSRGPIENFLWCQPRELKQIKSPTERRQSSVCLWWMVSRQTL